MKTIVTLAVSLLIASGMSVRAADAKANWVSNCAQCHGPDGSANTKMGKMLNAIDLTSAQVQASFTDAQATDAIKNGITKSGQQRMIGFAGKLTDDETKALVAYVRTLKK